MRQFALPLTLASLVLMQSPGKAETADLGDVLWRNVPGTEGKGEMAMPAYIEVNGLTREGEIVTFDLVNSDYSYGRLQTNCKTRQLRSLRQGQFESGNRVTYQAQEDAWYRPSNSYQRRIAEFSCTVQPKR